MVAIFWVVPLVAALLGWEVYWRNHWYTPGPQDSDALWASVRRRVETEPTGTVFIGSSRTLYNISLRTWQRELGGPLPIQLSLEGTSPRAILHDLANDAAFSGAVLVGVAPDLFFSTAPGFRGNVRNYYANETISQRLEQPIMIELEKRFAFLDHDLRLFTMINRLRLPPRPGSAPSVRLPQKMKDLDEYREGTLWRKVEDDPEYRELVRSIWRGLINRPHRPFKDADLQSIFTSVAEDVTKIRDRGGLVVFLREPSEGPCLAYEDRMLPRERGWDPLIRRVGGPAFNFEDHASLQGFDLPDWSHLSRHHKVPFTRALTELVRPHYEQWRDARERALLVGPRLRVGRRL